MKNTIVKRVVLIIFSHCDKMVKIVYGNAHGISRSEIYEASEYFKLELTSDVISVLVSKRHCSKNVWTETRGGERGECAGACEGAGGAALRLRTARRTLPPASHQSAAVARVG